jgi:hypothetical protein
MGSLTGIPSIDKFSSMKPPFASKPKQLGWMRAHLQQP